MARVLTPLDQFLERLRSQAHTSGPKYPSDKEVKCEQVPELEGQEPPVSSYPHHTHTLSSNYPPDAELECEEKCDEQSHFRELGRLANLNAEEGDFPPESASSVDRPEQVPSPELPLPPSAEEVVALPLEVFGGRSLMVKVWSRLLDGEIWFASGEAQVRVLQGRGIPREDIYTAKELADLLELFEQDAEKARLVLEAKKLFGGSMRLEKAP